MILPDVKRADAKWAASTRNCKDGWEPAYDIFHDRSRVGGNYADRTYFSKFEFGLWRRVKRAAGVPRHQHVTNVTFLFC